MAHQVRFQQERGKDISTIIQESTAEFERRWAAMEVRLHLISGKDFIALLSSHFQKKYGMSITVNMLFDEIRADEVDDDLKEIVAELDKFCIA
jgi:hypothetical protein